MFRCLKSGLVSNLKNCDPTFLVFRQFGAESSDDSEFKFDEDASDAGSRSSSSSSSSSDDESAAESDGDDDLNADDEVRLPISFKPIQSLLSGFYFQEQLQAAAPCYELTTVIGLIHRNYRSYYNILE